MASIAVAVAPIARIRLCCFWNERQHIQSAIPALQWLESHSAPIIVASVGIASEVRTQFYVPDNTAELLVSPWKKGELDKVPKRTEKVIRPTHMLDEAVHYLFPLFNGNCRHLDVLQAAARSITHLGWGVDMAVGDAAVITPEQAAQLEGIRWHPAPSGGTPLRLPKPGTLNDLIRKHTDFLNRVTAEGFRPVPPLRKFHVVRYRRADQPLGRPYRLFELCNRDGSRSRYSHRRLICIAGMVRHLAIKAMENYPPRGVDADWVKTYVAGHADVATDSHRQLSYLPLPSVGHEHTDPGIRRVMIAAPVGDDAWLDHVAQRLAGQALKPEPDKYNPYHGNPPLLIPLRIAGDPVTRRYTEPARVWHSFTPVILPGHDDHKPAKTRALIERALHQAGIDQPCEYEWSAFSRFPKSYSAHKYG